MSVDWETLESACAACQKCRLWETRTHVVVGRGSKNAKIMFVGEGPGRQEDETGVPFVGAAGQLLDRMLNAAGFREDQYYIANVVKCRPPGNRDPHDDEQAACLNYLRYQFMLIRPKILVCLGRISAQALIDPDFRITRQRGQWVERKGCFMMATYHPSALLRDATKKRPAWEDMQSIRDKLYELFPAERPETEVHE